MPAGKRAFRGFLARAALGAGALVTALATAEPAVAGPEDPAAIVAAVEVRIDASLPDRDLRPLIAIEPGQPLESRDSRKTLANFYASGLFSRVEILTRPALDPSQRVVMIVADRPPAVGEVRVEGETGLSTRSLRRRVKQSNGAILSIERVEAGVRSIVETLERRGYLEAEASWRIVRQVSGVPDVVITVSAGARAALGEVRFVGDLGFFTADPREDSGGDPVASAELEEALRLGGSGGRFDPERIEASVERLRRFLVRRGFLGALVEPPSAVPRAREAASVVDLIYGVEAGPLYEVETRGVERRWLERRGYLPLRERAFEPQLFQQGCARLRDDLQKRGHYRSTVECRVEQLPARGAGPARRGLVIEVKRGSIFEVSEIRFLGNASLPASELRPLVRLKPRQRLRPGSGRLVERELDTDLENLRSFYLLQGFLDARIEPARVLEEEPGRLVVEIEVDEGVRRRVVGLEISGVSVFAEPDLLAKLPIGPGGGFHPLRLEDSLNALRTLYEEEGYPAAKARAELDWNEAGTLVDVHFTVDEGPRQTLDSLVLRGLQRTRPALVDAYADLEGGETLTRRRLLEAERELYRLGVFSEVEVGLVPQADDRTRRNVSIRLEEGRRWRLSYGLSYHSRDEVGGLLGISRTNLRGLGERLQLDLRVSANDRRLRLFYDQPIPFGARLPLTWTLFAREEERDSFSVEESGFRVAMTRELRGGDLRLGLLYDYRLVELEIAEPSFDPLDLDREDQAVEISSLAPNVLIDRRDDALDPSRGWSLAAQLEFAFPFARAEADFLKLFTQYTGYADLGDLGILAGSVRLGLIDPLGSEEAPGSLPSGPVSEAVDVAVSGFESSRIPISERFFAGGRTTHRAYERDTLGILGQSLIERPGGGLFETGGNALVLLNLDWRFPIRGPVGGVAFLDIGNVWADLDSLDLADLRPGVGFGVRYASPVGPVRLEIGWKLDPEPFEEDSPVFLLSFGNPF